MLKQFSNRPEEDILKAGPGQASRCTQQLMEEEQADGLAGNLRGLLLRGSPAWASPAME